MSVCHTLCSLSQTRADWISESTEWIPSCVWSLWLADSPRSGICYEQFCQASLRSCLDQSTPEFLNYFEVGLSFPEMFVVSLCLLRRVKSVQDQDSGPY